MAEYAPGLGSRVMKIPLLPFVLLILLVSFGLVEPNVLSSDNLLNILTQASYLTLFATAQAFVLIVRGFDLSLGNAVSSVSVVTALVMVALVPQFGVTGAISLSLLAGLALGVVLGLVNGFVVTVLGVNPFVATLGTMNVYLGLSSTITGGFQVFGLPAEFGSTFNRSLLGVPVPVLLAAAGLLVAHVILTMTRQGRQMYVLGANPRAAGVAGIPVRRTTAIAYLLCGAFIAIGAMALTARTGTGEPNLGGNLTLQSIAAAVMGGVALSGGRGGIQGPVIGALLVTVLSNGMDLMRVNGDLQQIAIGIVIVIALAIDRFREGKH